MVSWSSLRARPRRRRHNRLGRLTLQPPLPSSILNVLPVTVVEVLTAEHGAHVLVRLDMQGSALLARITRYSHDQLGLQCGQQLWAQIKSVALLA